MKRWFILVAACSTASALLCAAGATDQGDRTGNRAFSVKKEINWVITSSPGGGSDIFTRTIVDIMGKTALVGKTFLIVNKTDGGGEVGRLQVSVTKQPAADYTLLTFNSGDLMPMVQNTRNRIQNFTPIAMMAVDKQLVFAGPRTKYTSFAQVIDAVKEGKKITMGGSKGDDVATYKALIKEIGFTTDQLSYITYNGTGDAITALLGGHIDLLISKPGAALSYTVEGVDPSKKLIPILALSTKRYSGTLANAPTLKEVGNYKDVEIPVWRSVVGPKDMSPEAAAFWSAELKKVSQSDQWWKQYIEKNSLISDYMDNAATAAYIEKYQADFMAAQGIQ